MLVIALYSTSIEAQFYNKDVEAKILTSPSNGRLEISATANNQTNLNKSLKYVLSVFNDNTETGDRIKESTEDRFIIAPSERVELTRVSINIEDSSGIILLLLIYDEDKLIGKDRIEIADIEDLKKQLQKGNILKEEENAIVDYSIKGIVTEDTKTKAGRDFYRMFYSLYIRYNINGPKVVSVKEDFSLGRSTRIDIFIENKLVFQFFAQPKEDYLKAMSQNAIYYVNDYFVKLKQKKNAIISY